MKMLSQIRTLLVVLSLLTLFSPATRAQQTLKLQGVVMCVTTEEVIPFATIALFNKADSLLIAGTTGNFEGEFQLSHTLQQGSYYLRISSVGYTDTLIVSEDLKETLQIFLRPSVIEMHEFVVMGERIQARVENNKTTFFMNARITEVSHTGADAIKYLPGVQIDFMQNLSLEGNGNVVVQVNGRERDLSYLRQIKPGNIDRVEIMNTAGAEHESRAGGVINIILKERERGFSGHIYADIPTVKTETYLFPSYNLQYGLKRFNFHTSYNGEISRLKITEESHRSFNNEENFSEITSHQLLEQKDWSHRFNYGIDFFASEKSNLNFYGFYNPWSQKRDGRVFLQANQNNQPVQYWSALKEDTDNNHRIFSSLYYQHTFQPGSELSLDISHYRLSSQSATAYTQQEASDEFPGELLSSRHPVQDDFFARADFSTPLASNLTMQTGVRSSWKSISDALHPLFIYHENTHAAYAKTSYNGTRISAETGLRVEKSNSGLQEGFSYNALDYLPQVNFQYRFHTTRSIRLSYQRSVHRPGLFQLNPASWADDPFSVRTGNPGLKPEYRDFLAAEYATRLGENFLSGQLFYRNSSNAIHALTLVNGNNIFESTIHNMGNMEMYGLRLAGALRISKAIALNPYFRFFEVQTQPGEYYRSKGVNAFKGTAWDAGLSAMASLPHNMSLSFLMQYNGRMPHLQSTTYSDALYFVSFDRNFSNGLMLGITSGIPFSRNFIFHGETTPGQNFHTQSEGTIHMSAFPVWFKLSYSFQSGKRIQTIKREKENVENIPGRGFMGT